MEMAGTKPAEGDLSGRDREMLEVSRAVFAEMHTSEKNYSDQVAGLTPELANLYSNESFTSRGRINDALTVLDKTMALDKDYLATLKDLPYWVKSRLDQTDLSDADKTGYLHGFTQKLTASKVYGLSERLEAVEMEWVGATKDLYGFALQHVTEIHIENGRLVVQSEKTRKEFNTLLDQSLKLRDQFVAVSKQLEEAKKEHYKQLGVTAKDLGVNN